MFGTPASNFCGASAHVALSMVTAVTMDPPVRNGGNSRRSSALPHKIPTPVGPTDLCPEKAKKSMSNSTTFTLMCGTD